MQNDSAHRVLKIMGEPIASLRWAERRRNMIKIIFADDHLVVRQQLKRLLGMEPEWQVIGEADNGLDAVRMAKELRPDVVVTDLALPGLHGLEVIHRVHLQSSAIRIVVVSIHADEPYVRQALLNGALGFVCKDEVGRHLLPAIRATLAGKRYLSPSLRQMSDAEFDALVRRKSGESNGGSPERPTRPN